MLFYVAALLAPIIILIYVVKQAPTSAEGARMPRWPEWTRARVRVAAMMGVASISLVVLRLSIPFTPDEYCSGTFASAMNSSISHGTRYLVAIYILAVPLMAIAILRRDAKWAVGALLLVTLGFGACFQASSGFICPGVG